MLAVYDRQPIESRPERRHEQCGHDGNTPRHSCHANTFNRRNLTPVEYRDVKGQEGVAIMAIP